jgi:hypothetical protein
MRIRSFSRLAVLAVALTLSACGLTPQQKVGVIAGLLIVGAIAAHGQDHGKPVAGAVSSPSVPCRPQPDGSCR